MNTIKTFLKKYWIWLVVGILLGLSVFLVWFFVFRETKDIVIEPQKIPSPYSKLDSSIDLTLVNESASFERVLPVFKVSQPNTEMLTNFGKKFFEISEGVDLGENQIFKSRENSLSYLSDSGVLLLFVTEGLQLDSQINTVRDVEAFFAQYFDIRSVENLKMENVDDTTKYQGIYNYKGKDIGSSFLNGYSYEISFNKVGKLVELKMLLLSEEDLVEYQKMYTKSLESLLLEEDFPMLISNIKVEDRYYDALPLIRASAKMKSITVKKIEMKYIFNNHEKPFVVPTYHLIGDGQIEDSQKEKYWTSSQIFICALDPLYLDNSVEDVEFNPVPYNPE